MSNTYSRFLIGAIGLLGAACRSTTDPSNDGTCQQTYEFGNYGCARFVVLMEGPPEPWPVSRRWNVRLVPINDPFAGDATANDPKPGPNSLEYSRSVLAGNARDTMSVYIKGTMFDDSPAARLPGALRVFAADSVRLLMRITPVGSRPDVDTVRLTLRWK